MGTSDKLGPQNTDNLQDDGTTTMSDNTRAVALVELSNGKLILITTERDSGHDGLASFEIDNDPASPTYGMVINTGANDVDAIIDTVDHNVAGAGYDNVESVAAITFANGNTFVYSADPNTQAIGITQVNADGTLTPQTALVDGTNLNSVGDVTIVEVDGQAFVLALAGGSSNNLLSYSVDTTTGNLTQVSDINDGSGAGENYLFHGSALDASFVEAFTDSSGTGFVLAGGSEDGISLFTIDNTGTLTFQNARGDDQAGAGEFDPQGNELGRDLVAPAQTGLMNVDAAAFGEIDGKTYVFVGGEDDDIDIFRIDADTLGDGTFDLTLVGHVDDVTVDVSALQVLEGKAGQYFLAGGGEQQGLGFAQIIVDPVTGVVSFDFAGAVQIADGGEPGAELWDVEDLAVHNGILVSASDLDDGVAVMTVMVCFAVGTQIMTEFGELPVEDLRPGDRVLTQDRGFQPILWIGTRRVSGQEIAENPGWCPVKIDRGAFGPNVPSRGLRLSRQHRVLIVPQDGTPEAIVPVKDCLALDGVIEQSDSQGVRYFHFLLSGHDIVFANGQPCETLWPGEMVQCELSGQTGFPPVDLDSYTPARPMLKGRPARDLVDRLRKVGTPMVPPRFMRLSRRDDTDTVRTTA